MKSTFQKQHLTKAISYVLALVVSFAFAAPLLSQPITGVWRGKITRGSGLRQSSQTVELKFIKQGDSLVGTAYYYGMGRNYVRYSIKGYFDQEYNTVHWQDYEFIDSKPKRSEAAKKYKESLKGEADFSCPDGKTMRLDGKAELPEEPDMTVELKKMTNSFFSDEWDWVIDGYFAGTAQKDIIDSVWMIASEGIPATEPSTGAAGGDIAAIPAKPATEDVVKIPPPATPNKEVQPPARSSVIVPEKTTPPPNSVTTNPVPKPTPPADKTELIDNPFFTGNSTATNTIKSELPAIIPEKKDSIIVDKPNPIVATTAKAAPPNDTLVTPKPVPPVIVSTLPKKDTLLTPNPKPAPDLAAKPPAPKPKPAPPRDITEEMAKSNREQFAKQAETQPKPVPPVKPVNPVKDSVPKTSTLAVTDPAPKKEPQVVKTITAPVMGTAFATRKKIVQTTIPAMGDSIELRFYDNAEVDGDSISLFLNGIALFEHVRLDVRPYIFKISVNDLPAESELTMVAENLGAIPPNTAYMEAYVNGQRYTARLESTEVTSAVIKLVRRE